MKDNHARKKAFHPKTRSGCLTCRSRRIKCDETRPTCLRCRKSGVECRGGPSRTQSPQAKALAPKSPAACPEPAFELFETPVEYYYFRFFSHEVLHKLPLYFDGGLWSSMILQACSSEPAIRHAAVAIGALSKTVLAVQNRRCQSLENSAWFGGLPWDIQKIEKWKEPCGQTMMDNVDVILQDAQLHHRNALQQYDMAIRHLQLILTQGEQGLRSTLITCLLIICFETIHGNIESAIQQLLSGIRLLQDWTTKQLSISKHPLGFSSPAPYIVDDLLCQTFSRLEIQVWTLIDTRMPVEHQELRHEGRQTIENMPDEFATIAEARIYLDTITRRTMHFIASSAADIRFKHMRSYTSELKDSTIDEDYLGFTSASHTTDNSSKGTLSSSVPSKHCYEDCIGGGAYSKPVSHGSKVFSERDNLLHEFESWECSFKPLLRTAIKKGGLDAISALTLYIHRHASLSLRSAFFTDEMQFDSLIPEWRGVFLQISRLLTIQDEYVQNAQDDMHLGFSFELGILRALYLTAIKCRDGCMRRDALRLLNSHPRREGIWDSNVLATVATWAINLEGQLEEGADDFVPEVNRISLRDMKYDLMRRTVIVTYLQIEPDKKQLVERRQLLTW